MYTQLNAQVRLITKRFVFLAEWSPTRLLFATETQEKL